MLDILAEFALQMLGELLLAAFGQDRGRQEPSPWERRQARLGWYWIVGILAVLALLAATWIAASHYL